MAKFKFRLLAGHHAHNFGTVENPQITRFRQGDTFETDIELDKRYNSPGATKFERLTHDEPDTEESLTRLQADLDRRLALLKAKASRPNSEEKKPFSNDDLDTKTLPELQEIAKANNIDLRNAKSRKDVLSIMQEALVGA